MFRSRVIPNCNGSFAMSCGENCSITHKTRTKFSCALCVVVISSILVDSCDLFLPISYRVNSLAHALCVVVILSILVYSYDLIHMYFYSYPSRLLHRYWDMITPVPVKQPWRIWVKLTCTKPQQNATKHQPTKQEPFTSFLVCTLCMDTETGR